MCMCMCMYTDMYIHACIHNTIPGHMSYEKEYISDHRFERTNMAAKWKYL